MDAVVATQQAIRLQSEDLREELEELAKWEAASVRGSAERPTHVVVPPIRGTAPSPESSKTRSPSVAQIIDDARAAGNSSFQRKDYDNAIKEYSRGIAGNENVAAAHVLFGNRSMCLLKLQRWTDAASDATTSIALCKGYAKGYYRRAQARRQLGQLAEAKSDLEAVLALSPNDPDATTELASVVSQLRKISFETPKPSRKPLVIEEVDDEDDADAASTERTPVEVNPPQNPKPPTPPVQETVRTEDRGPSNLPRHTAAKRVASHVEVLPDDVDSSIRSTACPLPSSSHTPPPATEGRPSSAKQPTSEAPPTSAAPPRWSAEALRVPRTFVEFERTFQDIRDIPAAMDRWTALINPTTLAKIFGSALSPAAFMTIIETTGRMEPAAAAAWLDGLARVRRCEEMVMLCDATEKEIVTRALTRALKCDPPNAAFLKRFYS